MALSLVLEWSISNKSNPTVDRSQSIEPTGNAPNLGNLERAKRRFVVLASRSISDRDVQLAATMPHLLEAPGKRARETHSSLPCLPPTPNHKLCPISEAAPPSPCVRRMLFPWFQIGLVWCLMSRGTRESDDRSARPGGRGSGIAAIDPPSGRPPRPGCVVPAPPCGCRIGDFGLSGGGDVCVCLRIITRVWYWRCPWSLHGACLTPTPHLGPQAPGASRCCQPVPCARVHQGPCV